MFFRIKETRNILIKNLYYYNIMDLLVIGLIVVLAIQLLYFFFKGEIPALKPIISQTAPPSQLVGNIIGGAKNISTYVPKQAATIAAKTIAKSVTHNLVAGANQSTLKNIIRCKNLISNLL